VKLLYRQVLLREASPAEVTFQVSTLGAPNGRVILARNFLNSAEFRNGTGPRLTTFLLHATLLLRDPNPGERTAMENGLKADPNVVWAVLHIVNGSEFAALMY
jgi:hypothetical protein